LRNRYATGVVIDQAQADELDEVIDGLVRQADQRRGTYTGYSAYLDCQFTVTPDPGFHACCGAATMGPHEHGCLGILRATTSQVTEIQQLGRALRTKTIATAYHPGKIIKRQLDAVSYLHPDWLSAPMMTALAVGVTAELDDLELVATRDEIETWIADYIAKARADR
jgi:hypothetical protein